MVFDFLYTVARKPKETKIKDWRFYYFGECQETIFKVPAYLLVDKVFVFLFIKLISRIHATCGIFSSQQ